MNIRLAEKKDAFLMLQFISELAEFEKSADQVAMTQKTLEDDGFGNHPIYKAWIIENDEGLACGMALCYERYSTWKGRILYLEDLIVSAPHRKKGYGAALLEYIIEYARQNNYKGSAWQVLDWNTPAIDLYKKIGAQVTSDWYNVRLDF